MSGVLGGCITRRDLLHGFGLWAAAPLFAQQRIGPPPHERGPKVFLDYDQVELDAAYNQAAYAPNRQQVQARCAANSRLTRERLGAPMRVAYGATEIERLDIYRAKTSNAAIHIHLHGGAWRGGSAEAAAYLAEPFVAAGAHFVVPDFVRVQDAGGSLLKMAQQVRTAIAWVYKNAPSFGGDPQRIYLSGHSSGAHLGGCALLTDWQKDFGVSNDVIEGALLVSGIYDLKGPRLSSRREYVKFDDETEEALSPQRHLERIRVPTVIAHASLDTPEFQRQSREFAAALKAAGKKVDFVVGEGYNHFEFQETLGNPYGILGRIALAQMNLRRA
jgi:arylformamidase